MEWLQQTLESALAAGSLAVYAFVFLAGVAASFTPCTYPVLPLTVGYVGSAAKGSRARAVVLSVALVFGMALVYAGVGIVLAAIGLQFGAIWANGWAVFAISWFFILMSLFLMDVFTFPTPRFLQTIGAKAGGRREGILGAFVVGGVSGLVIGPCTGPILGVVLVAVTTTLEQASGMGFVLQVFSGAAKLFCFGLGQGTLILICGVFAGAHSHLPKSGRWLVIMKKGFAMLVLVGASLILVYVGQATDFPDLTQVLADAETAESETESQPAPPPPAEGVDRFGGDEFLD